MTDQKATPKKRPRGRPTLRTEKETHALLIKAARAAFLTKGYSGTSIEAVAKQAGMSTRTIYKTVSNKASLFRLVADHAIETGIAHLNEPFDTTTPESAIRALARAYTQLVLGKNGVLTARAVLSEQAKFPEFRNKFLSSTQQVAEAFDRRFVALCSDLPCAAGANLEEAAALLRSLINGAQRAAILDPQYDGTAANLSAWSDKCTDFTLRALRSGPE